MVSVQRWPVTLDGDCVIAVVISWWCLAFDTAQLWRGDVSFVARVSALLSMGSQSTLEWGKSRTLGAFLYWVKSMKSSAQKVTPPASQKKPKPRHAAPRTLSQDWIPTEMTEPWAGSSISPGYSKTRVFQTFCLSPHSKSYTLYDISEQYSL